jgi:hypothetical protein
VPRILSHAVIAAVALVTGGAAAIAFSANPERPASAVATRTLPAPPDEVRTVVVTKTIHRVRHVKAHRPPAPAAPAPAPAPVPAPVAVVPRRVAVQAPAVVHTRPVTTRTSGHGTGGGEHEHEGGGDD